MSQPQHEEPQSTSFDAELIIGWFNEEVRAHESCLHELEQEVEVDPAPNDPIVIAERNRKLGELFGRGQTLAGLSALMQAATGFTDDKIERLLGN